MRTNFDWVLVTVFGIVRLMMRQAKAMILALTFAYSLGLASQAANLSDWKVQRQITLPAKASALAYSPDGSLMAVGHPDGRVSVWNTKTGEIVRSIEAHAKKVNTVQFTPTGDRLVTLGDDRRARLWSTKDWSEAGAIEGVAFSGGISPDGRLLAAQDPEQANWLWDLTTLKRMRRLTESGKGGTRSMMFTPDGKYLATAYNTPLLFILETKQNVALMNGDGKKTTVKSVQQGEQAILSLGTLQEDDAPTHRVIPSTTGSLIALGRGWYGQAAFIDVWDLKTMKRLGRYKPKDAGSLTSFSFDNSLLAVEGAERVTIWRIANGKQLATVGGGGLVQFSPRAMELAVTDGNALFLYVPK